MHDHTRWILGIVLALSACADEPGEQHEHASTAADAGAERLALAATEGLGGGAALPVPLQVAPHETTSKPEGFDADACPEGQAAIVGTAGKDFLTANQPEPVTQTESRSRRQ